jgi:hypothetical protein
MRQTPPRRKEGNGKSNGKKQEARLALRNARRAQIARKGVPYKFEGNDKSNSARLESESAATTARPRAGETPFDCAQGKPALQLQCCERILCQAAFAPTSAPITNPLQNIATFARKR